MSTDKKEHIILTAIDLFAVKGFEGTSIREIAAAANVNLAMINYYFGSKEKLFESIVEYRANYSRGVMEEIMLDKTISQMEKLERIIDSYVSKLFSNTNFHRVIYQELITNTRPTLQEHIVNNIIYPNSRMISRIIEEGIQSGEFNEVDARLTTVSLVGTINQILLSGRYCTKMLERTDENDVYEDEKVRTRVKKHIVSLMRTHLLKKQA